jgi:hypothetical protein
LLVFGFDEIGDGGLGQNFFGGSQGFTPTLPSP